MADERPWPRVVGRVVTASTLVAGFVAAAAAGIVLHLDLPPVRRLAARELTRALSTVLAGRLEIAPFDRISFGKIRVAKAILYDVRGRRVSTLFGVDVGLDPVLLLNALRSKTKVLTITAPRVRADRVEVELVSDATTGEPTIADALAPRPSRARSAEPSTGRSVRVVLPRIEIGSGTLHTRLRGVPPVDADVRGVQGRLTVGPSGIEVDVTRFDAVAHGLGTEARGSGTLSVHAPGAVRATFDGSVGDVELHAKGRVERGRVELSADAPSASPAAVRRFLPGWPLGENISGHVEASGDLPELRVRGKLALGAGIVTFSGPVILGDELRAALAFSGEHLDARLLSAGAPSTHVAIDGSIAAGSDDGRFSTSVRAHMAETEIDGYPVPALDAEATIREGAVSGTVEIHEPGLPTHAMFHVGRDGAVDVDADARAVDFRKVRPLSRQRVVGRGGAHLGAHLEDGNLTASLEATSEEVEVASVRISDARISVQARGPVASPEKLQGTAHVAAKSLKHGDHALENVELDARGNLAHATFDAKGGLGGGPEIALAGTLSLLGHPLLRDTKVSLRHGSVLAEGEIADFDPDTERFYIRNIRVTGAGGPLTGSARISSHVVEVDAEAEDLDVGALSRALALTSVPLAGRARVSLSFAIRRNTAQGHLRIGAPNLTIGAFSGPAEVSAELDDTRLTGKASGIVKGLGAFGASWNVGLSGPALELASLRDATGTAELQLSDAELGRLERFLPEEGPVEKLEGRASAKLEFERTSTRALLPSLKVTATTRGLAVVLRGSGKDEARRIAGVDVEATGAFDAESGATSTSMRLGDSHGDVASLTGNVGIDVPGLVHEPERAFSQLVTAPIDIRVSAPMRRIADLPESLRVKGANGDLGGSLDVRGTLASPTLRAKLDGRGLVVRESHAPVDLHAEAQTDSDGSLSGRGEVKLGKVSVATAELAGSMPGGAPSGFRGSIQLALNGLPLDLVSALSENSVHGRLSGTATLSTLEGGGALRADLSVDDAVVAGAALGKGQVHVATDGQIVKANIAFSGEHGSFDTDWKAGLTWGGLVPSFSREVPVHGRVVAKNFSVAPVSPLATGVLSRVGGHVDADLTVALTPKVDEERRVGWIGNMDGSAVLRDGTAIIDMLGVDVHDVSMSVRADGSANRTHIASVDIKGNLRGPTDNLRGSVDLELEGLKLVRGGGALYANDTPLFIRGAPQGRLTGEVALRLTREPKRMLANVDVPTLKLALPELSSRKVLDVADHPEIAVLQEAAPVEHAGTALPWRITIHLGRAVSVQRSDIELKVTGTPVVELGPQTRMAGSIELVPGGRLPVMGQVFIIERGLVTFDTGESDNPTVLVTAAWRAPNNTLVVVQVSGRLKEAQVALRSEPPMPEREVFALLFGGGASADPSSADRSTGDQGSAARTAAIAGSIQQLNGLLGESPVEFRVGSTSQARPRYTAAVRVRENLWFEASTYQQSEYTNDSNSNHSVVSGTVDYRFTRKWSLRMEAGTVGGALDLLWQHRY